MGDPALQAAAMVRQAGRRFLVKNRRSVVDGAVAAILTAAGRPGGRGGPPRTVTAPDPCATCDHCQLQHRDRAGACCQPGCKCRGFVPVVPQDGLPEAWPHGWPRPVAGAHVTRRGRSYAVTNRRPAVEAALAASLALQR